MIEKSHETRCGRIRYQISDRFESARLTLVFLPGLTADHRLFAQQIDCFAASYNLFVWDAPAHAASRPFSPDFSLRDEAEWLREIFDSEGIEAPVIIGQSMGGFLGQVFAHFFPDRLYGLISIDSGPMQKACYSPAVLWILKHTEPLFRCYPWRVLRKAVPNGLSVTEYSRVLMREMMSVYADAPREYYRLIGHGFRILAEAIEADLPYTVSCPALLLCGDRDRAGFTARYQKAWHARSGIPLVWIRNAGHNSNTDAPDAVNELIGRFLQQLTDPV